MKPPAGGARHDRDHFRHAAHGTLLTFIASLVCLPTGIITAGYLTRSLGADGYGQLSVVARIIIWTQVVIIAGSSRAIVKFVGQSSAENSVATKLIRQQLVMAIIAMFALCATAPWIADLANAPELKKYLPVYALDIPLFVMAAAHRSFLIGQERFAQNACLIASYWLSRMVFVLLLVGAGLNVTGAILASIAASTVVLVAARTFFVAPPLFGPTERETRNAWEYTAPMTCFVIVGQLLRGCDLLFIRALSDSTEDAGFYGAAQNLTIVVTMFQTALSPILTGKISKLLRLGQHDSAKSLGQLSLRTILCLLPFAGVAAGASHEIIKVIFGREFVPAAPILAFLIFSAIGFTISSVVASIMVALGRPKLPLLFVAPILPLVMIGHWLVIPHYGMIGAAVVTTAASWLSAGLALLVIRVTWQRLWFWPTLLRSGMISGFVFVVASSWATPGVLVFGKLAVMSVMIVAGFCLLREFSYRQVIEAGKLAVRL